MTGGLQNLTQSMHGAYTYCHRGLMREFFPDTFFKERGGTSGWISFSEGTLTNGRNDFIIWDQRTVGGSGVDVIFDLGADCWLDEVILHHVRMSGYGCGLGNASVSVRTEGESRYHFIASHKPHNDGVEIADPWLRFARLNMIARYVRLHLEPSGCPTYHSSSIGLIGVELLGLPLEEKRARDARPRLYPWPSEVTWGQGVFTLTSKTAIVVSDVDRLAAEVLRDEIAARFALTLPIGSADGPAIKLVRSPNVAAESYTLTIRPDGILIEGDAAGVFYGVMTLLQLLQGACGQVTAPAVRIADQPSSAIRGLHVYLPARENILYFKRLLDVMASLKLNTVILEVSGGMRYRKHPEVNAAWEKFSADMKSHLDKGEPVLVGDTDHPRRTQNSIHIELGGGTFLEQEEVRDLVLYARQRHITMIPEIQTLSHCYYIVCAHPELSERTDTPFPDTYCPSNPDIYPLVFDLLDEVAEVFNPPAICIGHDEAWALGICPRCNQRSAANLIAEDVIRLHDHLAKRNIHTWMYADALDPNFFGWSWMNKEIGCFSQPPDSRGLIDLLPKDVVAINWNWGHTWSHGENPDALEQVIHRAGLLQIFGNFEGAFCDNYTERAKVSEIKGAIMPSWVANAEAEIGRNGVVHNFIFTANVLWSSRYADRRNETIHEVIVRLPDIRARLQNATSPMLAGGAAFILISLDDHVNAPLADPTGALGGYDLRSVPTGEVTLCGTPFRLGDPIAHSGHAVIVVQSRAAEDRIYSPQVARIAVNLHVASLLFLHVASESADAVLDWTRSDNPIVLGLPREARQTIGRYRVYYADGSTESVDLCYDEHLSRWNTQFLERSVMPYRADPVWQGRTRQGAAVTLWRFEWINPRPEMMVKEIGLLAADGTDSAVILLALTAVKWG